MEAIMNIRKMMVLAAITGLLAAPAVSAQTQTPAPADPNLAPLARLFDVQEKIRDIHPAFERLHPVAIVSGGQFSIYVPDLTKRAYRLVMTAPDKYNVPVGIRAAMPLDFWGDRMACVVSPEVFDTPAGYATVFHEFVHCYQWDTCETRLKGALGVYKKAMERKDYMWELQFPFPYGDADFVRDYGAGIAALEAGDPVRISDIRKALKARLKPEEREYMTWQEWKEGFARFLENEIHVRLGLPLNSGGLKPPYNRVSFYSGGEALIRLLEKREPGLTKDIESLYHRIAD
jgi:hypothetical protein